MAFDSETLQPLYRLVMDEAGDSNALAIARKYGLPVRLVQRAEEWLSVKAVFSDSTDIRHEGNLDLGKISPYVPQGGKYASYRKEQRNRDTAEADQQQRQVADSSVVEDVSTDKEEVMKKRPLHVGDCVWIHPLKRTGIVFRTADERGNIVVQVQKRKMVFQGKRLSLYIPRQQLYPGAGYDLDIVF